MKADYDEEMRPEYDLSNAVRGKVADLFTSEQRERLLRDAAEGDALAWRRFALQRVQALETALFTASAVRSAVPRRASAPIAGEPPFRALPRLVGEMEPAPGLRASVRQRLAALTVECEWAAEEPAPGARRSLGEWQADAERLERLGREAEALKGEVDRMIRQSLAGSGMSEQEIERTTEETARRWLAA